MKHKLNLLVCILLSVFFLCFSGIVKADSGFDAGYDSGSSGSSSYSSSSSDSTSDGDLVVDIIIFVFVIVMVIIKNYPTKNYAEKQKNYPIASSEVIKITLGENFDVRKFYNHIFNIYKDIQIAWMNNNLDSVRHLMSDEMFNMYKMQLMTLTNKHQKNMMEDIQFVDAKIMEIRDNGNKREFDIMLRVTCYDYIIDENTNEVLRGNKNLRNEYLYKLSFIKTNTSINTLKCPNCGAKIGDGNSVKCEYCNSVIVKDSNEYILTEKKMLEQNIKF